MDGNRSGLLEEGPAPIPRGWRRHVETPQTEAEMETLRRSVVGAARPSARHHGRSERRGDWGFNQPFALVVGPGNRGPSLNESKQRLPTPLSTPTVL